MAIISEILRKELKKIVHKKIEKLDYEVDCVIEDIRQGQGGGLNTEKIIKTIEKAKKDAEEFEKRREQAEDIYRILKAAYKVAQATEKGAEIGSALNPAAAALRILWKYILIGYDIEMRDLNSVIKASPALLKNLKDFLKRSSSKIIAAKAAQLVKEDVSKQRKKDVG